MTDKEKELIIRAIKGDADAIIELYPDVKHEWIEMYQKFLNTADDASIMWFGFIMFFVGKNIDKARKESNEQSKRLADDWDKAMSNAIKKYNNEQR